MIGFLYEVTGGDIQMATDAWLKMFMPELIPFVIMFIGFDSITIQWAEFWF